MKNVYVYSYNTVSNGARELARALDTDRIRHNSSRFQGASYKTVINWGSSEVPREVGRCKILNHPEYVRQATNKRTFFGMLDKKDVRVFVPYTVHEETAKEWLRNKHTVVARTVLTGHSGHGIVIVEPGQDLPKAPLYTQYCPKSHEFRVHIVRGEVIDYQRKIRDPDREPSDWKVRSHDNGFIYVRGGVTLPEQVSKQAVAAFVASGLDFGAVDVIYSDKRRTAWVLEINTAPGLEGQTVDSYAAAFRKILKS